MLGNSLFCRYFAKLSLLYVGVFHRNDSINNTSIEKIVQKLMISRKSFNK